MFFHHFMTGVMNHFSGNGIGGGLGRQSAQYAMVHQAEYRLLIREFNFPFLGMNVHINAFRRHLERKNHERISVLRQQGMISIIHSLGYHCTIHHPPVNDDGLVLAAALQKRRLGNQPFQSNMFPFFFHWKHFAGRLCAV